MSEKEPAKPADPVTEGGTPENGSRVARYHRSFADVFRYELRQVIARRGAVLGQHGHADDIAEPLPSGEAAKIEKVRSDAHKLDLFGVAFSGGGIRSGTFNLGILQALASLKLLTRIDYLSTVSGGGYIGGWLAAWIRREIESARGEADEPDPDDNDKKGEVDRQAGRCGVENVQQQLDPGRLAQSRAAREFPPRRCVGKVVDEEPEPLRHLRSYSRYLTPMSGLCSLDTWAVISIYLRNSFMNLLTILPLLAAVILAFRFGVIPLTTGQRMPDIPRAASWVVGGILTPLLFAYAFVGIKLRTVRGIPTPKTVEGEDEWEPPPASRSGWRGRVLVVMALLVSACFTLYAFGRNPDDPSGSRISNVEEVFPPGEQIEKSMQESAGQSPTLSWEWVALPMLAAAGGTVVLLVRWVICLGHTRRRWAAERNAAGMALAVLYVPLWVLAVRHLVRLFFNPEWTTWLGEWGRPVVLFALIGLVGAGIVRVIEMFEGTFWFIRGVWQSVAGTAYGAVFGLLVWTVIHLLNFAEGVPYDPVAVFVLGPPLFLLAAVFAGYAEVALNGNYVREPEREWRSRMGGYILMWAAVWAGLTATIFYLPELILREETWAAVGAAAVWAAGAIATYLFRRSPAGGTGAGGGFLRIVATVAPAVTLIGMIAALSLGVGYVITRLEWPPSSGNRGPFLVAVDHQQWIVVLLAAAGCGLVGAALLFAVRVNTFSLHSLYANRLIRCYLGASRHNHRWKDREPDWRWHSEGPTGAATGVTKPPRYANEFTEFDARDDFPLVQLRVTDVPPLGFAATEDVPTQGYYGPYPLFNTTLNLVAGAALAEQDRKGESFVLTPDYCGNPRTGYARLPGVGEELSNPDLWENLTLGRAVTISGAAVDPNMRNFQSAPFTALLTLLNLRLGWWIENPDPETAVANRLSKQAEKGLLRQYRDWSASNPRNARRLLSELVGHTDALGAHVHLSDGGHFENTGAYELIRRRCRYVVVIDAAEDPHDASENLANLIRLVRIDFGIRIQIDTTPLHKDENGLSESHVAVGVIQYDDVDLEGLNGTLVFIRSSMTGDEPADLKNYAINNAPFPHHPTLDQFFNEEQFESYRMLGFHIGREVFAPVVAELNRRNRSPVKYNRMLFAELRREWSQVTLRELELYTSTASSWENWGDALRNDPRLLGMNLDLYPDLDALVRARADRVQASAPPRPASEEFRLWLVAVGGDTRVAEFRAVSRLVGIMEMVWIQTNLGAAHGHPLRRGWMNCFERWSASRTFHLYWPILRTQFSHSFVRFCERALNVPAVAARAVHWSKIPDDVRTRVRRDLDREFFGDWAAVLTRDDAAEWDWSRDYLDRVIEDAGAGKKPLLWVVTYGAAGERPSIDGGWAAGSDDRTPSFPTGVAAVRKWPGDKYAGATRQKNTDEYFEVLFWVRPGYRRSDAGHDVLPELLDEVVTTLGKSVKENGYLVTRFPKIGGSSTDSLRRAQWSLFFNDHEFYPYEIRAEVAAREVRLRRPITPDA